MQKITDTNYTLPYVQALAGNGLMDSGTTEPMKVRGVNTQTHDRGQFVVKYYNWGRMSAQASAFELLAAWMAAELEINALEPVVIDIQPNFVQTLMGSKGYQAASSSIGLNFGTKYVEGYSAPVIGKLKLNPALEQQAKMIFAFDMLIANADRINPERKPAGKPNLLFNGDDILVLDHELSFTFTKIISFLRNKTPWIFNQGDIELYETHFFYNIFHRKTVDFTDFAQKLSVLNDHFWERVINFMPSEWQSDTIEEIKNHIDSIVNNKEIFSDQLSKILLT